MSIHYLLSLTLSPGRWQWKSEFQYLRVITVKSTVPTRISGLQTYTLTFTFYKYNTFQYKRSTLSAVLMSMCYLLTPERWHCESEFQYLRVISVKSTDRTGISGLQTYTLTFTFYKSNTLQYKMQYTVGSTHQYKARYKGGGTRKSHVEFGGEGVEEHRSWNINRSNLAKHINRTILNSDQYSSSRNNKRVFSKLSDTEAGVWLDSKGHRQWKTQMVHTTVMLL